MRRVYKGESLLLKPSTWAALTVVLDRRSLGIHYSAYTQQLHHTMARGILSKTLRRLEQRRADKWPGAPITNFILVFWCSFDGGAAEPFEVVPWGKWKRKKGDCPVAESEVTRTIDRWRATKDPTTQLVELIFHYNVETHISLLMEIAVPECGPILRSIVRVL